LAAGRAVVCEKPLSTGVDSARRMTEQVEAAGVVASVPFVYRFYSLVREMRARIARGDAGRISLLRGSYLQGWLANPADTNWRVDATVGGPSRAFADIGIHWCDLLEFVTGQRITRLIATTATVVGERQPGAAVSTEDLAAMMFETDGGATGNLTISQVALGRRNQVELYVDGDRAAYGFNQEQPEELWIGGAAAATVISRGGPDTSAAAARYDRLPTGHPQGYQDCFDAFVADTYAAVRGERPDGLPGFADGLRAAQLTAAVLESAAAERWTDVGPATSSPAR
jgi:predicted dehydrogenase